MRKAQIGLLCKKETQKDKKFPKNYRPVALLRVDYKVLSKLLARKLGPHLCNILDETQFCQPGKEIGGLVLHYHSLIDDSERTHTEAVRSKSIWLRIAFADVHTDFAIELSHRSQVYVAGTIGSGMW